jgi:hypothetical protein
MEPNEVAPSVQPAPREQGLASNGSNGKEPPPLFWLGSPDSREEIKFFEPPIRYRDRKTSAEAVPALLNELANRLQDLPLHTWFLRWTYHTRAGSATAERESLEQDVRHQLEERNRRAVEARAEIEPELQSVTRLRDAAEAELTTAEREFAAALYPAGLTCDPASPDPKRVEEALQEAIPTLEEIAGEHGVGPAYDHERSMFGQILAALFAFVAPLVSGFMLALCLGTLIGLLSLTDLQRSDRLLQLGVAASLGYVIVYLMGELVSGAIHSVARNLEPRESGCPRLRAGMVFPLLLLLIAACLSAAEVTAEALGLRELHLQRLQEMRRLDPTATEIQLLPLAVYFLMGTLISGPYLAFKASRAWADCELRLRQGWLQHHQRVWLEQRRTVPEVQHAFTHAHHTARLKRTAAELTERLQALREKYDALAPQVDLDEATRERVDDAHMAAAAEARRLQDMVEELISEREQVTPAAARPPAYFGRRQAA